MASVKRKRESSPSPSSSSTCQPKHDVFLSFRGEDTRYNFTGHLYAALKQKGIITFRDEEDLKRGERISELFKAIEGSQFAIIIFSKNYASSRWCLDELVKSMECRLKVLPVFYNVSPSDVKRQTGTFEQAFTNHQKRFKDNIEKVETWRDTLKKVALLKGWDLSQQNRPEYEIEIIQQIVKEIMKKLSSKSLSINKNLIGIKSIVEELIPSYLGFENDIYMMGICGMGGLGKTTLAKAIYYKYSDQFEGSSFIANVRERSEKGKLHKLQQQLLHEILGGRNTEIYNVQKGVKEIKSSGLRHKKVLLILDDVNHNDQLENLAEEHDWFGSGSWIIITTRDQHVLANHGVKIYTPNFLDDKDASKLFCLKAFKKEQPEERYRQLFQEVLKYARGLPLALVTLGLFLFGRTVEEWQSALDSLKNIKLEIHDILKISYDGLEERWKEIFLDIACFFRGWNKDKVIQILENCGFDARIGVSVLVERSLLTEDEKGCFGMHDLLSEMGQKIIRFESDGKLGKQSRLWLVEDLLQVMENDMATEAIQAIVVQQNKRDFNFEEFPKALSKMSYLRLMIIDREYNFIYNDQRQRLVTNYLRHDQAQLFVPNQLRHDQAQLFVPNQLRHLSWTSCPLKRLSSSSQLQLKQLVQLDLKDSKIEYLPVMRAVNLKVIDLSFSIYLISTPDFSGVPMLEKLDLSDCSQLVEIHPSIVQLSKLRYLNLSGCESLTDLPSMSTEMQSLAVLNLSFCYKFSSFPKFTGIMESLSELHLSKTAIKEVAPSSIEFLTALTFLDLSGCEDLERQKSFPRLPSSVRRIHVPRKIVGDRLSSWSNPLSQWCPKANGSYPTQFDILFNYQLTIVMFWVQGRGLLRHKTVYGISSKGEEDGFFMRSCLTETRQYSISINLPSNWYNSKWIGFALWASVVPSYDWVEGYWTDGIKAHVIALSDVPQDPSELFTTYIACEDYGVSICLLYLSRDDWFAKVGNGECSQIKFTFEKVLCNPFYKYFGETRGISLVYEREVDEFDQTNAQCLIESFGEEVSIFKFTVGDDDDDIFIEDDDDT